MELACTRCKRTLPESEFYRDRKQRNGRKSQCKDCAKEYHRQYMLTDGYRTKAKRYSYAGRWARENDPVKQWAYAAYYNARSRAKRAKLQMLITIEWLIENAPTHCPLLGIPLVYGGPKPQSASASLDRKNNDKGYTPDNCRIVSFKANRIKSDASADEIRTLARNLDTY